ncbi:hypothetical protein J2128_000114 [Methanomicrobium sp. W14]|uniref:hypothetical protein n=1 Tax=Methanomicrobium sp. W14 TaxID=2817839 RepID=UPI001AE3FA13|nr:hypothetical protein [Methanomicrobium sp. W14]MBP2132193.1 hypothetical protein [Methanomicrobium sp. W14]
MNGDKVTLYENGDIVESFSLSVDSPNSQSCTFDFSDKSDDTYSYCVGLSNSTGFTRSDAIEVTVI